MIEDIAIVLAHIALSSWYFAAMSRAVWPTWPQMSRTCRIAYVLLTVGFWAVGVLFPLIYLIPIAASSYYSNTAKRDHPIFRTYLVAVSLTVFLFLVLLLIPEVFSGAR